MKKSKLGGKIKQTLLQYGDSTNPGQEEAEDVVSKVKSMGKAGARIKKALGVGKTMSGSGTKPPPNYVRGGATKRKLSHPRLGSVD